MKPFLRTCSLTTKSENKALYGCDSGFNLVEHAGQQLERQTLAAFLAMTERAQQDGIELAICSGYRDFDRQLAIFNAKALGKRALLDKDSIAVNIETMDDKELLDAILIWSALPGTSRHHWGTDIDLYDASRTDKSSLQLISAEYEQGGPCHKLSQWLDEHAHEFGFFRPFQSGKSGVSPEPWHYSYFPVSQKLLSEFNTTQLRAILEHSDIALKHEILNRLDDLVAHYVFFIAQPKGQSSEIAKQ